METDLPFMRVSRPLSLRMAVDSSSPIDYFVKFPSTVGSVLSVVAAYIVDAFERGRNLRKQIQNDIDVHDPRLQLSKVRPWTRTQEYRPDG